MKNYQVLLTCMLSLFLSNQINARSGPEESSAYQSKPLVKTKHSMVVTNNKWATKAAVSMLNKGGNAYDAAIAAGFVLGLTEPQSSGIGGGGYALTYSANDQKLKAYDGREVAPQAVNPEWFLDEKGNVSEAKAFILSAKSIGVPAEVALFYQLHKDQGKLAWSTLLQPAINLAREGFPMSPRLHKLLTSDQEIFIHDNSVRAVFFSGEHIKTVGQIIKNPAYANTLKILAKNPESFYRGKLANEIINDINQTAGKKLFELSDFRNYRVVIYPAMCSSYREKYRICSIPPSSAGGTTVQELLGIYANRYTSDNDKNPEWLYYFLESSKLSFADRNKYLADPAFINQPIEGLLDKDYLTQRGSLINNIPLKTPVAPGVPKGVVSSHAADESEKIPGTTSVTIVDKDNNAISMTVTVESQFGSHLFTHGFFLNNELADFSFESRDKKGEFIANRIEPGKRPRSSMSPTMVFDKDNKLSVITGSPGGSEIICYVAKNLILMLDMGLKPNVANDTFNLCATNKEPVVEAFIRPIKDMEFLQKKYEIISRKPMVSGITTIQRNGENGWYGSADPRREGVASGN